MISYRHADRRFPFLWEGPGQPAGRWNGEGDEPAQYFSDTPDGAWAEFLRHEGITTAEDLSTVTRALWAVELPDEPYPEPRVALATQIGGVESYEACRREARRLERDGARGLRARSAALLTGGARGWRVLGGLRSGPPRDGYTLVLFGGRPDLIGWRAAIGRPDEELLPNVRGLSPSRSPA